MNLFETITPDEIRAARKKAGLTQKQAANIVMSPNYITWQQWERGLRKMPSGLFMLFLLMTCQLSLSDAKKIIESEDGKS